MTKAELVSLLRESPEKWNTWRASTPDLTPDLSASDLSKAKLQSVNLKRAFLPKANFMEAYLRDAHLEEANLERAFFRMSDLGSATLKGAHCYKANFRRADLWKANLSFANLKAADFGKAILQEVNLEGANLESANLQNANLRGANLKGANLKGANLEGANIENVNFKDANLEDARYESDDSENINDNVIPTSDISFQDNAIKTAAVVNERPEASATSPKGDYPPDTVFGVYELKEKIARGGMGIVYRAIDRSLQREVAIKILSGELKENPEYLQRFLQEARVTAKLDHPNIISIHAIGEEKGEIFVAMQFVRGKNIAQLIKEKHQFTFDEALMIVRSVALALSYAHENGLIHRDIKPDNIMIDESKRVRVMDFGIARDLSLKKRLTQEGHFMGTIHYSAPEQWASDVPDPRSDIYSLGVVLYEILAGRLPYDADSPMNLLYKITRESPVPLSTLRPDIPAEIESLVNRMLSKDLDERFFKAHEVVETIDIITSQLVPAAREPDDIINLSELNELIKEKLASSDQNESPTGLLLMLEDLEFATKGKKKFLGLKEEEAYTRKLGSGWFYVLFRETLNQNLEEGKLGSHYPVIAKAKKGRTLTEDEVLDLCEELKAAEKDFQHLPLTEIWTLSIDMKTRETLSRKIRQGELKKIATDICESRNTSEFTNLKDFFQPIFNGYQEVCTKALEHKTGAFWK